MDTTNKSSYKRRDFVKTTAKGVALATVATGLLALVKPTAVYGFTGLTANGVRGVSEIRAIFGGLLTALGFAPLFLGPVAYQMLGIGYLGIAVARILDRIRQIHRAIQPHQPGYRSSTWRYTGYISRRYDGSDRY